MLWSQLHAALPGFKKVAYPLDVMLPDTYLATFLISNLMWAHQPLMIRLIMGPIDLVFYSWLL